MRGYGLLQQRAGKGSADFDIDIRLYDVTAGSMVANDSVYAVRITSGSRPYGFAYGKPIGNIKLEANHTYIAYLFLSVGSKANDEPWVVDEFIADFKTDERYGAYLDNLKIDFK